MKKLKRAMISRVDDWSRLPDELLRRIVENYMTSSVLDYVMFSCVCRSWNSIACDMEIRSELRRNKWTRQMPLLMLTDGNTETYDITNKKPRTGYAYKSWSGYDVTRLFNIQDYYVKDHDLEKPAYLDSDDDDDDDDDGNKEANSKTRRCLLNLSSGGGGMNKCYKTSLPEAYGKACWGSRYGWIVTLGCDRQMNLLNPLTKATLPLPSQWTFPFPWKGASGKTIRWTFMERAVLLLLPRDNDCHSHISRDSPCSAADHNDGIWLVVVLHHDRLASFAKPGDSSWTPILRPSRRDIDFVFLDDVTYCPHLKSLLFVDTFMKFYICDLGDIEHPQVMRRYFKIKDNDIGLESKIYIVESGGETLIIQRHIMPRSLVGSYRDFKIEDYGEFESHLTFNFRVYKIDFQSKDLIEMHDLGNLALFVGDNATFSVSSTNVGCEPNCVYFSDDFRDPPRNKLKGHDMGIFKMDDRTIRPLYDRHRSNSSYCCPFWFCPSL